MAYSLGLGIRIRAPRDAVFERLLTPHHMARWFCSFAQVEPKPGGRLRFGGDYCVAEPPEGGWECTFTGGEVRKSVTFAWPLFDADTVVMWAIEDVPDGSVLHVTHDGLPKRESTCGTFQDAWRTCLGNLKAIAEGRGDSLRPDSTPPREPRIALNLLVDAAPEAVWATLITPEAVRAWAEGKGDPLVEPRPDGRYGFGGEIPGTIAAIEDGASLAVDRLVDGRPVRVSFQVEGKSRDRSGLYLRAEGFAEDDAAKLLLARGRWTERLVAFKNVVEVGETGFTEPYAQQVAGE